MWVYNKESTAGTHFSGTRPSAGGGSGVPVDGDDDDLAFIYCVMI